MWGLLINEHGWKLGIWSKPYDEQIDFFQPTCIPEFNMEPETCQKEIRSPFDDFPQPLWTLCPGQNWIIFKQMIQLKITNNCLRRSPSIYNNCKFYTPRKTNMTIKKQPCEDVSPINKLGSFGGVTAFLFDIFSITPRKFQRYSFGHTSCFLNPSATVMYFDLILHKGFVHHAFPQKIWNSGGSRQKSSVVKNSYKAIYINWLIFCKAFKITNLVKAPWMIF